MDSLPPLYLPRKGSSEIAVCTPLVLRETCAERPLADKPATAAAYWREHVPGSNWFDPMKECAVVMLLNTRNRIMGHSLVSLGTLNQVLVEPRAVFRPAIIASAYSVILVHNHPSGDPTPSDSDIRATRDICRSGKMLRLELQDHLVIGEPGPGHPDGFLSFRERGLLAAY
jgi:DNA repair protein RadC